MKYVYKCPKCGAEKEVQHSVVDCETYREYCTNPEHEGEFMYRAAQVILTVWPGGKPSET